MRTLSKLALLLTATFTLFGCAHNYYSIPQETLEKKVKTIGIAHFFVDPDSDIRHPEKDAIVNLIQTNNTKYEKELIARIRETGIFYAVRQVDGDPVRLFTNLVVSRERRDDAGIIYNKYFHKKDELKQLVTDNGLDAIVFVTVSGLTRPEKIFASNFLSYLETDFNYLSITAQMLDRDGNTIWEYPNFRRSALSYPMFFRLQYPDFDEAEANLSDKVDVKFKTVAGVKAAFARTEPSAIGNGPPISSLYSKQFNEMLSLLQTYKPLFGGKKTTPPAPPATEPAQGTAPAAPTLPPTPEVTPAPIAPTAPAIPAPAVPAPAVAPVPVTPAPVMEPATDAPPVPMIAPQAAVVPVPITRLPAMERVPAPPATASVSTTASRTGYPLKPVVPVRQTAAPSKASAASAGAATVPATTAAPFPLGDIVSEEPPAK